MPTLREEWATKTDQKVLERAFRGRLRARRWEVRSPLGGDISSGASSRRNGESGEGGRRGVLGSGPLRAGPLVPSIPCCFPAAGECLACGRCSVKTCQLNECVDAKVRA